MNIKGPLQEKNGSNYALSGGWEFQHKPHL